MRRKYILSQLLLLALFAWSIAAFPGDFHAAKLYDVMLDIIIFVSSAGALCSWPVDVASDALAVG